MLERQTTRQQVQPVQVNFDHGEAMIAVIVPGGQVSVPAVVLARIEEWARWVRVRSSLDPRGHCRSIEWKFESPYPDRERGVVAVEHDLPAVLAVERVVCRLPRLEHDLAKLHFVVRAAPKDIAIRLSIRRDGYGYELKRAVLMIRNSLTRN